MKPVVSTVIALLIHIGAAYADPLWTEGFENSFPPTGWSNVSVDQSPTYAFDGNYSAKLGAAGDELITPPVSNAEALVFWTYTTSSDPQIIVEHADATAGPWTEFRESPFSGYTDQWNGQSVSLADLNAVCIRFRKSGSGTLYIDNVSPEDGNAVGNQPPVFVDRTNPTVFEGSALSFSVQASDPVDDDPVTLIATNLPTGAVFADGQFTWACAAPVGKYAVTFIATDKDGATTQTLILAVLEKPGLLISEIADPDVSGGDAYRFVELYNAGNTPINLDAGNWHLSRQINGGTWQDVALTGTLAAASCRVIAKSEKEFQAAYGVPPDQAASAIDGNGDDAYALWYGGDHSTGTLIDIYGATDIDGSDTAWDYENSRAIRRYQISGPSPAWTAAEWEVSPEASVQQMTPGIHCPLPEFIPRDPLFVFLGDDLRFFVSAINTARTDIITLSAVALPEGVQFSTITGTNSATGILSWQNPPEGTHTFRFSATGQAGTVMQTASATVSSTSRIDGSFAGWNYGTIIKLNNGQFWQNTGGTGAQLDQVLRNSIVSVTNHLKTGTYRITVAELPYTTARQIEISGSRLTSEFFGLHHENIYQLEDGTVWQQISFEDIPSDVSPASAWRWTEDGKQYLRLLDLNQITIGTCLVKESATPANPTITARINSWFRGWQHKRVFALDNGEFWQQTSLDNSPETLYRPSVILTNRLQTGSWFMSIENGAHRIAVTRLTNATHSVIDGRFYGLQRNQLFKLEDGSWWQQTSTEHTTSTRFRPDVLIWHENETAHLELPDEGCSAEVTPLNVCTESSITNTFSGLHYGNSYRLLDGSEWMQISFEQVATNLLAPKAVLWQESDRTFLLARDPHNRTIGFCTVAGAQEDSDHDGACNADEIIAGTDALDVNSQFLIANTSQNHSGQIILSWNPVEERRYIIQWTPSLQEPFQTLTEETCWPQGSWTNSATNFSAAGFYRIFVEKSQ